MHLKPHHIEEQLKDLGLIGLEVKRPRKEPPRVEGSEVVIQVRVQSQEDYSKWGSVK